MTALDSSQSPCLPVSDSALSPLRRREFRTVWSALAGSQLVIWMNTVGAVTVIAARSDSATLIALVQAANSLPSVLLALPAGAVADILDRRRMALACQLWMLAAVTALLVTTLTNSITPVLALALTFALGTGMATTFVAYQALTPDAVPRAELPAAVTLNGVAINLARAAGPALGGLAILLVGAGGLFATEAVVLLAIVAMSILLRPRARPRGSAERFAPAVRAGLRFVRFSSPVRAILIRGGAFSFCAGALWALLPVVAIRRLGLGSGGFGLLMGAVGTGAVLSAALLPGLRRRVAVDRLIAAGSLGVALGLLAMAVAPSAAALAPALLLSGACWLTVLSSLNTAVQRAAPGWVRARTLATFQLVMQGGLAAGSVGWGLLAGVRGPSTALIVSASGLALGLPAARRWPLGRADTDDLTPAASWSDPSVSLQPAPTDGPVLITVEYVIDRADAPAFVTQMREQGRIRRRDGARRWDLYADLDRPGRYLETFVVDSWEEHLRQHDRLTVSDLGPAERVRAMHRGAQAPRVRHLLWAEAALAAGERRGDSSPEGEQADA